MKYEMGISGAIIVSGHNGYEPFIGSVAIRGDRIEKVVTGSLEKEDCEEWIDGTGKILMPGLVNAHCHGDMTLARGLGDDLTLLEQNEKFADTEWFYTLISDEDRYYSRQLTYCEALLSGTTFIMENMYWGLGEDSVKAMVETGIKGALAEDIRVSFVRPDDFVSDAFLEAYGEVCQKNGILPILGGISEEDYKTERLKRILEIARKHGMKLTCHLAENTWRRDIVRERYNTTAIDYLYGTDLLGSDVIGSHVVYATDEEVKQLKETDTKVVNTPLCEMKICDGIAPIPEMVKQGVTVCLGTDGSMWNNSNDIFREMKGMSLLHTINSGIRSLTKKEILDMATINGAKCFGLEKEMGTIEEGKKADLLLIETNTPHMQPIRMGVNENVTSAIVFNATGQDVTDVFVNGRHVVSNGELLTVKVEEIMNKVKAASEKIADYLQKQ
ncbi:amidohydrolase family protein [Faecalicatena acetigenes]|uniref:Amidohydrolase family protein n=1 Tax=Faecalicatena acetigenes TaxID=2981790 RepID=A0ABT2T830_9FIRM|nr:MULTISPECIES: amidohydrolase family protein [Lachnospiraceae]MCU6746067.1 amidohydrolase family protein [Faecalicatena acetigenes]SCG93070.1 5-methylthioadenosine/S-adenosylhomocysteine deaminase [uncultured Clostridium sp.]